MCATGSESLRNACYAVASGAYDVAMAVGVEKLKDSGFSGLVGSIHSWRRRRRSRRCDRARQFQPAGAGVCAEIRCRSGRAEGRPQPHRLEEPPERVTQPAGSVPQAGTHRDDPGCPPHCRNAGRLRLFRRLGRVGRGDRGARRGRASLYRQAPLRQRPRLRGRSRGGHRQPVLRLHHLPGSRRLGPGCLSAGRRHQSARGTRHGRGPRLLHTDRAGADGGSGLFATWAGLEGRSVGQLRPRW